MIYTRSVRRDTVTDKLEEALAFALTAVEEERIDHPSISIESVMVWDEDTETSNARFQVTVGGVVGFPA